MEKDVSNDEMSKPEKQNLPRWIGQDRKERVVFTEEDLADVHDAFGHIIYAGCHEKVRLKEFARSIEKEEGKALVKKFRKQTLLSKLRTERKNHLNSL